MFQRRLYFLSLVFMLRLCFKGVYVSRATKNTGITVFELNKAYQNKKVTAFVQKLSGSLCHLIAYRIALIQE